jgi:class 3 adenylate cyclase
MSYSEDLVHYLLGDPRRPTPLTVEAWVRQQRTNNLDEPTLDGSKSLEEMFFECACAELHDSRLLQAAQRFRLLAGEPMLGLNAPLSPKGAALRVLSLLGQGRALNGLHKFGRADHFFKRALDDATAHADPVLVTLTRYLRVMNLSDWGAPLVDVDFVKMPLALQSSEPLRVLFEASRVHALCRVLLRKGDLREGLGHIEALQSSGRFQDLAPIPQGSILRMRGILESMCNRGSAGRTHLKNAIEIFRAAGYHLGEVQAALSLARTHAPMDRQQTRVYLSRAQAILDETDPPNAREPQGRQMPYERADLYSRLADFEFAQGDFRKAAELYQKDLRLLEELAAGSRIEELPRAAGYVHRNLGRVRLAEKKLPEAIEHFSRSTAIFYRVDDAMNVFFSRVLSCEALLAARRFKEAEETLRELDGLVAPREHRNKERAIFSVLRALLLWRQSREESGAHVLLDRAKSTLWAFGRDYHYARALLAEAEILGESDDKLGARQLLIEARRIAVHDEIEDLRQEVEERLLRLGIAKSELLTLEKNDLEALWENKGFVRVELSILFADIRGFTAACLRIEPTQMAEFIGEFARLASRCSSKFEGLPVRFLGDCVMALFGVRPCPNGKEVAAVEAACEMHHQFLNLRDRWSIQIPELESIGLGFGIATGLVVPGRFGSGALSEFSVIGEAVNRASRLQGNAEDGEILLCSTTAAAVRTVSPQPSMADRRIALKGFGETSAWVLRVAEMQAHRLLRDRT